MAANAPGTTVERPLADAPSGDVDLLAINTIRTLAMDAVEKAKSGHAGAPMGLAPVGYTLWRQFLRSDPDHPEWPNRDRFVLSNGHASMLLYSLLHLAGVKRLDKAGQPADQLAVSLDDIKAFRELDGVCAGHPEYGLATGVEVTTGPLGQGAANSVGMAIAGRWLETRYNFPDARPDAALFDYNVYVLCSDGDLMEGVASEAASIAGHLALSNLCWIYDDNSVTIDGRTDIGFTEDVAARFRAYGWATHVVEDANDTEAFARKVEAFQAQNDRPTLIVVKSIIGYGAPDLQGTPKIHSDPLGPDEIRKAKRTLGWPEDADFLVPEAVPQRLAESFGARGRKAYAAWQARADHYARLHPAMAKELALIQTRTLPDGWDADIPSFAADEKGMASREASGEALNAIAARVPWMIGGGADLSSSTKTKLTFKTAGDFQPGAYGGRNLHFGVREHAMGSIANGLAVSHLRPFTGTFFIFSDYMRPPTRLAALMGAPTIFVFTHDSIGLGQDGPTHQPIEQLAALRAIPHLMVIRPGDANEAAEAWRVIVGQDARPAALILSRQAIPTLDRTRYAPAAGLALGAYVLADAGGDEGELEIILIGTGGELTFAVTAYERLAKEGVRARLVSMPSWDIFEAQDQAYRDSVLPPAVTIRLAVEAAAPLGWDRYVGAAGEVIAMRTFGASAPTKALQEHFGFTADNVHQTARRLLDRRART
ncbi:MAG: transketolase [Caulobacteraceae bacterium]|nr:transketolase [Caulobacteraceae bacterium]